MRNLLLADGQIQVALMFLNYFDGTLILQSSIRPLGGKSRHKIFSGSTRQSSAHPGNLAASSLHR